MLQLAKAQDCEAFFYGNAFAKDNPHQTDQAFGYTPDTPFGLDNVHMAQGDPRALDVRLHENGVWHDGACFIWDARARRMSAVFLAFQSQAWHTNDSGDVLYGATGCEAPLYDFGKGAFTPLPIPKRAAEITSAHCAPDGSGAIIVVNMTAETLDLTNWRLLIDAQRLYPLPDTRLTPGLPFSALAAIRRPDRRRRPDHADQRRQSARRRRRLSRRRGESRLEHELRVKRGPRSRRPTFVGSFGGCAAKSPMLGNPRLRGSGGLTRQPWRPTASMMDLRGSCVRRFDESPELQRLCAARRFPPPNSSRRSAPYSRRPAFSASPQTSSSSSPPNDASSPFAK